MSPEDVKKVWDATPHPNCNTVSRRIRLAGGRMSPNTVDRYRKQGWITRPRTSPIGRPRHGEEAKTKVNKLDEVMPAVTKDPCMSLTKVLKTPAEVRAYLDGVPMDTTDAVKRSCNKYFGEAIIIGARLAADPDIKPKDYVSVMQVINDCIQTINSPTFGMPIPESLRVIEGETVNIEKIDERDRQLRELLLDDVG